MLSKSIEQLRQPNVHLQESEEEEGEDWHDQAMQEDCSPSGGVIRKHSPDRNRSCSPIQPMDTHPGVIRVKEEPNTSDDEMLATQSLADKQSSYINQVNGRVVIRAMIWNEKRRQIHTNPHTHTSCLKWSRVTQGHRFGSFRSGFICELVKWSLYRMFMFCI